MREFREKPWTLLLHVRKSEKKLLPLYCREWSWESLSQDAWGGQYLPAMCMPMWGESMVLSRSLKVFVFNETDNEEGGIIPILESKTFNKSTEGQHLLWSHKSSGLGRQVRYRWADRSEGARDGDGIQTQFRSPSCSSMRAESKCWLPLRKA